MLGLSNAVMCGQKAASGGGSGTVISLLHGEGVVEGAVIDSASPPASYTKLASGGYFTNYTSSMGNIPKIAPVGSGCILMGFYDSGTEVKSNSFAGVPINTPLTMEGYFIYDTSSNNAPQYINIMNLAGDESVRLMLFGATLRFGTPASLVQIPESQFSRYTWHFVRLSFDGTSIKAYIDGSFVGEEVGTVDLSNGYYISFKIGVVGEAMTLDEFRVTIGQALGAGMPTFPLTTTP